MALWLRGQMRLARGPRVCIHSAPNAFIALRRRETARTRRYEGENLVFMPKTADKRAQARRIARVQRAHEIAADQPITRRAVAPQKQRSQRKPGGVLGFVRTFPVMSSIILIALLAGVTVYAQQNKLGPFAPKPIPQAVCNLKTHHCNKAPIMFINIHKLYIATIHTVRGNIVIQLDAKNTPITTNNFVFLAQTHYFDGTYFWRVEIPGKPSPLDNQPSVLQLIQGGSVTKNGQDPSTSPGYKFKDEKVVGNYTPGTVAMANAGPNTNGAQFFIDTGDNSKYFSKSYTIFGKVISGLD